MCSDFPPMDLPRMAGPLGHFPPSHATHSRPRDVPFVSHPSSSEFDEDETDDDDPSPNEDADRIHTLLETACCNPIMKMTQSAFSECMQELTSRRPEAGGMLLGPADDDDLITHYVHDRNGQATAASFTVDAAGLNRVLRQFKAARMNCKGLIHSHPCGVTRPSHGDLQYVAKSFANHSNDAAGQFFLPIVCNDHLYPYVITRDAPGRVSVAQLLLV